MSGAAFVGMMALAFVPGRSPSPQQTARATPAASPSTKPAANAAPGAASSSTTVQVPAATNPAAAPSAAAPIAPSAAGAAPGAPAAVPPPETWTPEELAAGLRQCIQLLAPATADVAMEEPVKSGQCGTPAPLALRSVGGADKVEFSPPPTMNCRLAASLSEWVDKVLQPAAQQVLGLRIKRIVGASSYSCRNIYNNPKLSLSEHATGNAIDIVGFVTADGRTITVKGAWGPTERDIAAAKKKAAEKLAAKSTGAVKASESVPATPTPSIEAAGKKAEVKQKGRVQKAEFKQDAGKPPVVASIDLKPAATKEAAFLKRLHGGSCTVFATVLGPEANEAHRDHFHLDMKVRRTTHGVCH
jgi:hypothetical protein